MAVPTHEGQKKRKGGHNLIAVEGNLPVNDLVWRCRDCHKRSRQSDDFKQLSCDSGEAANA